MESLGIHDIVAKSMGIDSPYNMVRATFDALKREDSPRERRSEARDQGLDAPGAPGDAELPRRGGDRRSTSMAEKTIVVEQTGPDLFALRPAPRR